MEDYMKEMIEKASEILRAVNYPLPKYIKILCVDNSEDDIFLLQRLLNTTGIVNYQVEGKTEYKEALEEIAKKKHDIYLIDFRLGVHSGIELINQCSERGDNGPFIIWSAYNDEQFYEEALKNNISGFIPKSLIGFCSNCENENREKCPVNSYIIIDNIIRYCIKNYRITDSARKFLDTVEKKRKEYNF